ncbi:GNAT family N-acetyltransferase [Salinibacillus xinjiangensis]|uniref:GNAT family N-acetyltransferase n=1 Tax=Salinibacillus xinjiangensis TaxID=1229268 RepID=A0A6G1X975_9BACI|nr:GNAT family N-acetyltransferase [Salinibacillus xinjiangensis]MRG87561.1 GNAT family N-acetyltransferase [Salinibacillus xinjiangensis]
MIYELNKKDFSKCQELANNQRHIEVKAIIHGHNPGRVFVDDVDSPNTALVWLGDHDGFFFIGDERNPHFNEHINSFIDLVIAPAAKKEGLDCFEAIGSNDQWGKVIPKLFPHRELGSWTSRVYSINSDQYRKAMEPTIAGNYEIHRISIDLLNSASHHFMRDKVLESWSTMEDFMERGMGYCVMKDQVVVAVCYSNYSSGREHTIAIETVKEHRGKKLAKKLAHYYLQACFDEGVHPYWDCMVENRPSVAIAKGLGYVEDFSYVGYDFGFSS